MSTVTLHIERFDPTVDRKPHMQTYVVEVAEDDRVLDALHEVRWHQDGTLAFRRSCAHGVCGSDAMVVNGHNRLACILLIKDVGHEITIEPMRGLPVLKDLVVDMRQFFDQYRSVQPWLHAEPPPPGSRERLQSPEERARYDDTTKCILCAACTTSCPVYWSNDRFVGPAALVLAHRFLFDSRDEATAQRHDILDGRMAAWGCRTAFNCTDACPRHIKVTQAIEEVRRDILRGGD